MQTNGGATPIKDIIERSISLKGGDHLSRKGFTMVPNFVLLSAEISPGAKLCFAMLLRYAWQNDYCFPGQERLAADMGVSDRSVRTYLNELEAKKLISIKQRGLGKSNLYEINLRPSRPDRKFLPVRNGRRFRSKSEIFSH